MLEGCVFLGQAWIRSYWWGDTTSAPRLTCFVVEFGDLRSQPSTLVRFLTKSILARTCSKFLGFSGSPQERLGPSKVGATKIFMVRETLHRIIQTTALVDELVWNGPCFYFSNLRGIPRALREVTRYTSPSWISKDSYQWRGLCVHLPTPVSLSNSTQSFRPFSLPSKDVRQSSR